MNSTLNTSELTASLVGNQTEIQQTPSWDNACVVAMDVLVLFITYGTMVFMGCDITWKQLKNSLKNTKQIFTGLFGQYVFMPFCGFLAVKVFQVGGPLAAGVLIVSCSPGGPHSNLISYLIDGDLPLSVILTTISSVISFGVMPGNIYIYEKAGEATGSTNIPYLKMFISLILLNVAMAIGMFLRWMAPNKVYYVTKCGVALVCICNLIVLVLWFVINPNFLFNTSWKMHAAVIFVCCASLAMTALLALLLSFPVNAVKTLAVETSYQSIGVAYTISVISFERQNALVAQIFIFLYNLYTTVLYYSWAALYQVWKRQKQTREITINETDVEQDAELKS